MTGYRHAPSRLPMNKLKSLLQKTRKVTLFVWKSIRKNTPLSSEIHCERFEPRSHIKRLSLIVRVNVVLNRTVVVDSD